MSDPIHVLSTDECWELLHDEEFGRLAFHLAGEVHITPINYAVDQRRIVFRTAPGSKLLGVAMNPDVAFEIDGYDDDEAYSVILRGTAHQLEGREAQATDQLRLRPWVPTEKYHVIAVEVDEISGRRFDLAKPWTHLQPQDDEN